MVSCLFSTKPIPGPMLTCWQLSPEEKLNSLSPGKFESNFRYLIFQIISLINGWGISSELVLRWMLLDLADDNKSTLVQVMAWCRQATNHYLSQCWPRSLSPYGITRHQWVKGNLNQRKTFSFKKMLWKSLSRKMWLFCLVTIKILISPQWRNAYYLNPKLLFVKKNVVFILFSQGMNTWYDHEYHIKNVLLKRMPVIFTIRWIKKNIYE